MLFRQAVCVMKNPRKKKGKENDCLSFHFLIHFFFVLLVLFCIFFSFLLFRALRSGGLRSRFLPLGSLSRVPDVALRLDGNELLGFGDGSLCTLVVTAILGAFV